MNTDARKLLQDTAYARATNDRKVMGHHSILDDMQTGIPSHVLPSLLALPMKLREVLHAHIPTLDEQSTIRDAVDKMDVYQFPALVIVNANRAPIAVITEGDIVRAANQVESVVRLGASRALSFATKGPVTMTADADIGDAFHTMAMSGLTILPVVEDEMLLGVVLRVDLMQAILTDSAVL